MSATFSAWKSLHRFSRKRQPAVLDICAVPRHAQKFAGGTSNSIFLASRKCGHGNAVPTHKFSSSGGTTRLGQRSPHRLAPSQALAVVQLGATAVATRLGEVRSQLGAVRYEHPPRAAAMSAIFKGGWWSKFLRLEASAEFPEGRFQVISKPLKAGMRPRDGPQLLKRLGNAFRSLTSSTRLIISKKQTCSAKTASGA